MDQDLAILEQYINEARLRFQSLQDTIDYPSESLLSLDSSIKKNSAFVKRLKVFTESQREQILNEIDKLNLSKFTSEVAASIIEAKLKPSDIPAVIEICTKINKLYRDFSKHLLDQYVKYFRTFKRKNHKASFDNLSDSHIRLFVELLVSGVFPVKDLNNLRTIIAKLTLKESKKQDLPTKSKQVDDIEQSETSSPKDDYLGEERTTDEVDRASSSSFEESIDITDIASSPAMTQDRVQPDQYFSKLSNCLNRDMVDSAAVDFIRFFNTNLGRRKLVKTLFNVQRTRLDLLPFFARLTATLYPFVPSVANELVALLKQDFRNLFRKKDQINIESKVKNVRFIGELVKFNLYPRQEALNCLKLLLSDFTHHHIEMACNLLETCGRLLYKTNDSHDQLCLLLEQMMRRKLLLSIDSKYVIMIENAYYFTNPPEVVRHVVEEPHVHIYVRYLLCESLNRSTIETVLKKIKKLNWNDKTLTKFVIKCMTEAYNLKFYNIRYLAALLASLNKDHEWISIAVVDGVVEDILLMMEINELHFNQRRIPMIRYFGELYNYRLTDSSLVFKILYSLITYGVNYPAPDQAPSQVSLSQLDLPDNLFRIKLVCDLLETCGQYLTSGQGKRKLDCYLLFFQRYYWCKKHIYLLHSGNQFPASIEYLYNDAIYNLRPTFEMATSYSQAIEVAQNFIDSLI